jgi:hypothetical protein
MHHALSTPSSSIGNSPVGGAHIIIGGRGGEGRATIAQIAALLSDYTFFSVPNSPIYDKHTWRSDLKRLIRGAGCQRTDTVIYVTAGQMAKKRFLLNDICSLMVRGEVFQLFSVEERNELNEVKHCIVRWDEAAIVNKDFLPIFPFITRAVSSLPPTRRQHSGSG